MRHTLTFRLENPTDDLWFKYKSLIPEVDQICNDNGLIVEKRVINEDAYEITVDVVEPATGNLHNASMAVTMFLGKQGIENKLVYQNSIKRPTIYKASAIWTLAENYRTDKHWNKWVAVMPEIDSFAGEYDVRSKRILDSENYNCELTNTFTDMENFTKFVFYSSQLCVSRDVILVPFEEHKISEVIAEDIFSKLKSVTQNHKQLTLF